MRALWFYWTLPFRVFLILVALFLLLLFASAASAETTHGTQTASVRVTLRVVVVPVFQVMKQEVTMEGTRYSVFTNMPEVTFQGTSRRFPSPGVHEIFIPASTNAGDGQNIVSNP